MYVQSIGFSYFAHHQDPRFKVVTRPEELEVMLNALRAAKSVAFDYETDGLAWWRGRRPCGVGFTTQAPSDPYPLNWYVPFRHKTGQAQLSPEIVIAAQKEILENPAIEKIAHNAKFELHMSRCDGIAIKGPLVDTMIEARLWNEDLPAGLKARMISDLNDPDGKLHEDMLNTDILRLATARGMGVKAYKDAFGFAHMEIYLCGAYGSHDTFGTWGLHQLYENSGVRAYYSRSPRGLPGVRGIYDVEMGLVRVLAKMEAAGQPIDVDYLKELNTTLLKEREKSEVAFFTHYGCEYFNLGSDDQLRDFLKKGLKCKWGPDQLTDKGQPAVDYDTLSEFAKCHPQLEHILRYKEVEKKLSTYTLGLVEQADEGGVLHCNYQQVGTNCMPAGQLVLTSRGYKPVENVRVGDFVLTHEGRPRAVTQAGLSGSAPIYRVCLRSGIELRTTADHAYRTPDGWVAPSKLTVGQKVLTRSAAEVWRPVSGFQDFSVSSWGRVRNRITGHMLSPQPKGRWGHLRVCLYRGGVQKRGPNKKDIPVHRLVAKAFLPKPLRGCTYVRHLNGLAWDNSVENLAWGTPEDNGRDARAHGTSSRRDSRQGKLTDADVREIRSTPFVRRNVESGLFGSDYTLALRYGVSRELVRDVRLGKRWLPTQETPKMPFLEDEVVEIWVEPDEDVYGLTVAEDHSHVTGGVVTHNTGRLSCKEPNLQNISSDDSGRAKANGGQDPESIKRSFIVSRRSDDPVMRRFQDRYGDGVRCFRQFWDYSQIELRVLADYTRDARLVQAYLDDKDIHDEVEKAVFGTGTTYGPDGKKSDGPNRRKAKCFHPDTEVLTRTGWKRIVDLADGEEVVQALPRDGFSVDLEWAVPTEVFTKPNHSDRLVHLHNEGMDLRVTPDHRMAVWGSPNGKPAPFKVVNPYEVQKQRGWMNAGVMAAGDWAPAEQMLRLAVAIQADGSLRPGGAVTFGFSKERKKQRLRRLLAGVPFTESTRGRVTSFYVPSCEARALLTDTKEFPWTWLDLTPTLRDVVLEEICHWDSHVRANWRMVRYTSTSCQSLDVVQAIAALSNRKTRKALITGKDAAWNLTIRDTPQTRGGQLSLTELPYSGDVACLSVPSTFVLVRDGKAKVPVVVGQTINFGLSYCMSPTGFARQIKEVTPEEAQGYFDEYNRKFPGVPEFRNRFWNYVRMNKAQFDNKFGRTRHVPGILSSDNAVRKRNERMSIATLIQGTAAELTKESLVRLDEYLEEHGLASVLSQTIHDEIQVDGPLEEFAEIARVTHQIMTDFPDFCVPIKVDGKYSVTHWSDKSGIPGI